MRLSTEFSHRKGILIQTSTTRQCDSEERAITGWCNYHLGRRDCQIQTLADLEDGVFLIALLELLSGEVVVYAGDQQHPQAGSVRELNWKTISKFLGSQGVGEFLQCFTSLDTMQIFMFCFSTFSFFVM